MAQVARRESRASDGIRLISYQKAILQWITSAKKPETRAKRVEEAVTKAEKNICANQWRGVSKT